MKMRFYSSNMVVNKTFFKKHIVLSSLFILLIGPLVKNENSVFKLLQCKKRKKTVVCLMYVFCCGQNAGENTNHNGGCGFSAYAHQ